MRVRKLVIAKLILGFATVGVAHGECKLYKADGSAPVPCPNVAVSADGLPGTPVAEDLKRTDLVARNWNGQEWVFAPQVGMGFQVTSSMPAADLFTTHIVINRLHGDIVGAPQSDIIQIEGSCKQQVFQVTATIAASGKWGTGMPDESESGGPELVLRNVVPGTFVWAVFQGVCKQ